MILFFTPQHIKHDTIHICIPYTTSINTAHTIHHTAYIPYNIMLMFMHNNYWLCVVRNVQRFRTSATQSIHHTIHTTLLLFMYVACSIYITVADPGFEVRGAHFFRISYCTPPPLRGFPVATIKVYTWIFLGFKFAPPLNIFPEATIKVYTWIF